MTEFFRIHPRALPIGLAVAACGLGFGSWLTLHESPRSDAHVAPTEIVPLRLQATQAGGQLTVRWSADGASSTRGSAKLWLISGDRRQSVPLSREQYRQGVYVANQTTPSASIELEVTDATGLVTRSIVPVAAAAPTLAKSESLPRELPDTVQPAPASAAVASKIPLDDFRLPPRPVTDVPAPPLVALWRQPPTDN